MDVSMRFHLGYSAESGHVRVDSSPLRGGESSHEHSPNQSTLDGNTRNIRSPRRNVTSRIMNGMKQVKSVPDIVSCLKSKSKRAFPHSRSQSLDSAASMLVSSLSPNETANVDVSASPEDGRGSLCYPCSPDSSHTNGSETIRPRLVRKMVRVLKPTSNQLASLNLKEGCNIVTFLFFTSILGKQQVDAKIYLWKWNRRVIISVDGTITKCFRSVHAFDGDRLVSYRGNDIVLSHQGEWISHALPQCPCHYSGLPYRRFLINLNQNGKALPDGPVVISPDGLFPSLYRQVIIRRPHEFKIACLEEIKSLFPSDYNPFYAGFGNRDMDKISYLKVGIPKGKIFIINPRARLRSIGT